MDGCLAVGEVVEVDAGPGVPFGVGELVADGLEVVVHGLASVVVWTCRGTVGLVWSGNRGTLSGEVGVSLTNKSFSLFS